PASASLAFARNKRLGRGLNLSDVLDGPEVQPMDPAYFRAIRAAGFSNLRICIRWVAHCAKEAPYTINPAFFRQVDQVVRQSLDNGLDVVLDIHYYPGINMPVAWSEW